MRCFEEGMAGKGEYIIGLGSLLSFARKRRDANEFWVGR